MKILVIDDIRTLNPNKVSGQAASRRCRMDNHLW